MLKNIDVAAFKDPISQELSNNLDEKLCASLASILAIDYATRLESKGITLDYVNTCISKLKRFLKSHVITDNSFSTALTLFTVAISPEDMNFKDKNSILNQEQSQDASIDAIVGMHFDGYSKQEQGQIKLILKSMLAHLSPKEILNYFASDPQVLKNIVSNALKTSAKQQEMNDYALGEINKIFQKNIALESKSNRFKQMAATIATSVASLAVMTSCALVGGIALPIVLIPTAVLSLKFAPVIGEKLGETILNYDKSFNLEKKNFQTIKNNIVNAVVQAPDIEQQQTKDLTKGKSLDEMSQVHTNELAAIKDELQAHKSEIETASPVISASKRSKGAKGRIV